MGSAATNLCMKQEKVHDLLCWVQKNVVDERFKHLLFYYQSRSSRSFALPCGPSTSVTSTTQPTAAPGSAVPSTTSRSRSLWPLRQSPKVFQPSLRPVSRWALDAWPPRTPSCAPSPPSRLWAAPASSAPTRPAHSPPIKWVSVVPSSFPTPKTTTSPLASSRSLVPNTPLKAKCEWHGIKFGQFLQIS